MKKNALRSGGALARFCSFCSLLVVGASICWAQPAAFTYQGKLTDAGNPANGNYDLQFKLFDNATVGLGTQHGGTLVVNPVAASAGIFTVQLNFGAAAFGATGVETPDLYLEIGVRPAGSGGPYTLVAPRQKITSSPYAIETINATYLGGVHASRFVQTDVNGNVGIGTNPAGNGRLEVLSFGGNATYSECVGCTGVYGKSTSGVGVFGKSGTFEGVRGETSGAGSAAVIGYNLAGGGFGVYGSSTGGDGVAGVSSSASGVHGASTNGAGVFGDSTNGPGVYGRSSVGSGVYGESSRAQSLIHAGVLGVGMVSGSIGVHGAADVDNAVGVFGTSTSATGYGMYAKNSANHALWVDGNAGQTRTKGGIVKAMVHVLDDGTIARCFNSQLAAAAATTVPCGYSLVRICPGGQICQTEINFGFTVSDRFWSATAEGSTAANPWNRGVNVSPLSANVLKVSTFLTPDLSVTIEATAFMLIVF